MNVHAWGIHVADKLWWFINICTMLLPLSVKMQLGFVLLCFLVMVGYCLPLDPRARMGGRGEWDKEKMRRDMEELRKKFPGGMPQVPGLDKEEYRRYFEEIARNNPKLHERLKQMRPEDLPDVHAKVGERMARSSEEIRSRLEEARRMNIDEMRQLQRLQTLQDNRHPQDAEWRARREAVREHMPPHFNNDDLQKKLEEQRRVLEELDQRRREDFRHYEMQMEHQRRKKLQEMDEKKRLKAEEEFRKQREELLKHEKLNHPASRKQLEEVWEEEDGFKGERFDPKTFFYYHDTNGDARLDPMELEALFYREVQKAYGKDFNTVEAHEEMARMREHALTETDTDKDGTITLQEFLVYTSNKDQFEENEEWKPVVDDPSQVFSEDDFNKFEEHYDEYYNEYDDEDYLYDENGNLIGLKTRVRTQPPPQHQEPSPPQGGASPSEAPQSPEVKEEPQAEEQGEQQEQGEPRDRGDQERPPEEPQEGNVPQGNIPEAVVSERKAGQAQQFEKNPQDNVP